MIRVLFVCLGNICRSPMAEAVFQQLVREAGLSEKIIADSAGTGAWHIGKPPHSGTLGILKKYKITDYNHRARQIQGEDMHTFNYILTMDAMNLADVKQMFPHRTAQLLPLMTYDPNANTLEVPDPYYDGRFEEVYALVREACIGLLHSLMESEKSLQ